MAWPCPDTRLIAVLRNPIDRAYSAYRMAVRHGSDKRPVEEALSPPPDRSPHHFDFDYVGTGMYGKILEEYLKYFPASQIRLVFTEDLAARPKWVMQDLFGFIGVDADTVPGNLHQRYHRDGNRKYPILAPAKQLIGKLEKLFPNRYRGWSLRFEQWNTRPMQRASLPPDVRNRLTAYYQQDIARLEQLFRVQVPWQEFRSNANPLNRITSAKLTSH